MVVVVVVRLLPPPVARPAFFLVEVEDMTEYGDVLVPVVDMCWLVLMGEVRAFLIRLLLTIEI